jgi:hypothetical protein
MLEARQQLSKVLARFREQGPDAEPMFLGSHRSPEAVLLPYPRYRAVLDELAELRAFRERYRADVAALASVRLEGQEPDVFSGSVARRQVAGELGADEALAELDRHFGHPRARS